METLVNEHKLVLSKDRTPIHPLMTPEINLEYVYGVMCVGPSVQATALRYPLSQLAILLSQPEPRCGIDCW